MEELKSLRLVPFIINQRRIPLGFEEKQEISIVNPEFDDPKIVETSTIFIESIFGSTDEHNSREWLRTYSSNEINIPRVHTFAHVRTNVDQDSDVALIQVSLLLIPTPVIDMETRID